MLSLCQVVSRASAKPPADYVADHRRETSTARTQVCQNNFARQVFPLKRVCKCRVKSERMMMMSKMMTTSPAMIKTRTLTTGLTTLERTRGASSHLGILTVVADSHTHTPFLTCLAARVFMVWRGRCRISGRDGCISNLQLQFKSQAIDNQSDSSQVWRCPLLLSCHCWLCKESRPQSTIV